MPRIVELYAYVVADTGPEDEGVPAFADLETGFWMPLMGADFDRAQSLRPKALEVATMMGKPVKLVRSLGLETVEVLAP